MGKGSRIYYCRLIKNWRQIMEEPTVTIYITEGEWKGIAPCSRDLPVPALGGVWMWKDKRAEDDLIEDFKEWVLEDRWVHIVFDPDAEEKASVLSAESELMQALVKKGARVKIVRLPAPQKLDDYFEDHDVKDFKLLCDQTREHEYSKRFHAIRTTYCDFKGLLRLSEYPLPSRPQVIDFKHIEPPKALPLYPYKEWLTGQSSNTAKIVKLVPVKGEKKESKTMLEAEHVVVNVALDWFDSSMRKRFAAPGFAPGQALYLEKENGIYLNFWKRTGIKPQKGDGVPWFHEISGLLFPVEDQRQLMLCWAAYPLINPGARNNWAPMVMNRIQGAGKTSWGLFVAGLHGPGNWIFVSHATLKLPWTQWQDRKTMILGDNLCGPNKDDYEDFDNKVDVWITAPTLDVNIKGGKTYPIANHANYYFSTNHSNALPIDQYTRRFYLPDTSAEAKHKINWKALYKIAGSIEGQAALPVALPAYHQPRPLEIRPPRPASKDQGPRGCGAAEPRPLAAVDVGSGTWRMGGNVANSAILR